MSTYGFQALFLGSDENRDLVAVRPGTVSMVTAPGVDSFVYEYEPNEPGETPEPGSLSSITLVDDGIDIYNFGFDGTFYWDDVVDDASISILEWLDDGGSLRSTVVLSVFLLETGAAEAENQTFVVTLGGDPLPTLNSVADFEAFDAQIQANYDVPAGHPFAAGQEISVPAIPGVSLDEDDVIIGTPEADSLEGGAGFDAIVSRGGDDFLSGGSGDDVIEFGWGDATIVGGEGYDDLTIYPMAFDPMPSQALNIEFLQGLGMIRVNGQSDTTAGASIYWTALASEIERVTTGFTGDVIMTGDDGNNRIKFAELPAVFDLDGAGGSDRLELHRAWHEDEFGNPARGISSSFFNSATTLSGTADNVTIVNSDGSGLIGYLRNFEQIRFTDGTFNLADLLAADQNNGGSVSTTPTQADDSLTGTSADDVLNGLGGNDTIRGMGGEDTLIGNLGDDSLVGGDWIDVIYGGSGDDFLSPGNTADYYWDDLYSGAGQDTIDFQAYQSAVAFGFVGFSDLSGTSVVVDVNSSNGTASVDKGALGTTTILNSIYALRGDGLGISGTWGGNDTFNVELGNVPAGQYYYLQLQGYSGNDTYNISSNYSDDAGLRITYHPLDVGITADLENGWVDKGIYGIDTIFNNSSRGFELRGTRQADQMTGSTQDESFISRGGDDTIDGAGGFDRVRYDRGGVEGGVNVNLTTGLATGVWYGAAFTHTLANVEYVVGNNFGNDVLVGNQFANRFVGKHGDDTINGMAGNDTLFGDAGNDRIDAGDGDDRVEGGADADLIFLGAGEDTVAGQSYELEGDRIVDMERLETVVIYDILSSPVGSAVFTLNRDRDTGFTELDLGSDGSVELAFTAEGDFDIFTTSSYAWNGRYSLVLQADYDPATTFFGDGADNSFTGTSNDERLLGEAGDDTLNGGAGDDSLYGGPGADLLIGGPGSDVIYVDSAADRVAESRSWAGHDTVISSVDFRMGRKHIEDLELTGNARIGAGNGLQNVIKGNDGDNILDGGKNNDTLIGGEGNDTYLLRAPGDTAVEEFGEGVDTVKAYGSFALGAHVERLYMQNVLSKAGTPVNFNGIGNGLDNTIVGTPYDNTIVGREGRDTLKGQAGADTFVFDRALGVDNVDRIIDFNVNTANEGDILKFKGSILGGVSAGTLAATAFASGTAAADADDRFIFDQASGRLWFDVDGSGAAEQELVATFEQNASVIAADILIF
jgi:Ca2+-binding RTX toxin-like protein